MPHPSFAFFVYMFAILWTLALMLGLPAVLIALCLKPRHIGRNRVTLLVTLLIGAGSLIGGVIGWLLRPAQWRMAFGQTFEAAFNAAKYGDALEHQAERVLMYPWYMAVLCSIAVAAGMGLLLRLRRRAAE